MGDTKRQIGIPKCPEVLNFKHSNSTGMLGIALRSGNVVFLNKEKMTRVNDTWFVQISTNWSLMKNTFHWNEIYLVEAGNGETKICSDDGKAKLRAIFHCG